jgi:hypothetical protein
MPLPSNRPASDIVIDTQIADVSAESSAFAVATHRGRIHKIYGALQGDVTGTSVVTIKTNGTTLPNVSLTVSGGAGTSFQSDENGSPIAGYVSEGDKIEFVSDGGSGNSVALNVSCIISKM